MFRNVFLPYFLAIMLFMGLVLSILTTSVISSVIGEHFSALRILLSTLLGSIAIVPRFIRVPAQSHGSRERCYTYSHQVAVLISPLMAVGVAQAYRWRKDGRCEFCLCSKRVCDRHATSIRLDHSGGHYRFLVLLIHLIKATINKTVGLKVVQVIGQSIVDMFILLSHISVLVGLLD